MPISVGDTNRPRPDRSTLIRASELAQYDFCQRAWWLGTVQQLPADNQKALGRGRQAHLRQEDRVIRAGRWRRAGFILVWAGGLLLLVALLWLIGAGGG